MIRVGGQEGVGVGGEGGWGAEGGFLHTLIQKSSHYVLMECSERHSTLVRLRTSLETYIFIPSVALLYSVPQAPSSDRTPHSELLWIYNATIMMPCLTIASKSRPCYICSSINDVSG